MADQQENAAQAPTQPMNASASSASPSPSSDMTPSERKLYETLLAGLLDFMWGKGMPDIQRQLQQATPDTLATIIGHITFALVQQGAEQGESKGHEFSFGMLIGVATELIESLEKMAAAMNIQVDPDAVSLRALVQALNDYAETLPDGSQEQKDAKEALKSFSQQDWQQAHTTLSDIASAHGASSQPPSGPQQPPGPQGAPMQGNPGPRGPGLMGAGQ